MIKRIRLGIDVGGTFTKAVAIDVLQSKIVGKATVPTTHSTVEGVSTGILAALTRVIQENNIEKSEIELISHSTTQAVNALLAGRHVKDRHYWYGSWLRKSECCQTH